MLYLALSHAVLLVALIWLLRSQRAERTELRQAFEDERAAWRAERRDLNNRIQVPEAAPYMDEEFTKPNENDLPLAPSFTLNEDELRRAREELEAVGYDEGPVA